MLAQDRLQMKFLPREVEEVYVVAHRPSVPWRAFRWWSLDLFAVFFRPKDFASRPPLLVFYYFF